MFSDLVFFSCEWLHLVLRVMIEFAEFLRKSHRGLLGVFVVFAKKSYQDRCSQLSSQPSTHPYLIHPTLPTPPRPIHPTDLTPLHRTPPTLPHPILPHPTPPNPHPAASWPLGHAFSLATYGHNTAALWLEDIDSSRMLAYRPNAIEHGRRREEGVDLTPGGRKNETAY